MLKIFVNTWGNYNENGADGGKWVKLPMDEDELDKTLEAIAEEMGDFDPEFTIHDYEWDGYHIRDIGEHENIHTLNETIQELSDLDEWDVEEVMAAVDAFDYSIEKAIEKQQNGYFTFYRNMELIDVAESIVDECYDLPEFAQRYFDYEAFARDLGYDGYIETEFGVIYE